VGNGDIHTDKYGRVQVQFHWDREDAAASVWVRVSQGWAGAGFGQIHIPRVGEEVVVDFLEGDPDRPLITGRLYNSNNMPPYALPANKTQYGIKTNSVGASGSNELRFEDKGGDEQIYVHAQKDLDTEVENNETRHVKVNRSTNIDVDETTIIGGNKKTEVTGNFDETITGTETRQVTGAVTEKMMAGETRTIMSQMSETINGTVSQTVTGTYTQTVAGAMSITCAGPVTFTAAGGWTLVAPAGTKTVDSFFDKTGGFTADAFGSKLSIVANKTDMVGVLAMSVVNNKVDFVKSKIDIAATVFKNEPTSIKTGADAIRQAALNCHFIGIFLVN
jgi:type VI secretion system secreted protein VgrG